MLLRPRSTGEREREREREREGVRERVREGVRERVREGERVRFFFDFFAPLQSFGFPLGGIL